MKPELGLWQWRRIEEIIGSNSRNIEYLEMKVKLSLFVELCSNALLGNTNFLS